jgi:hypothetical protein
MLNSIRLVDDVGAAIGHKEVYLECGAIRIAHRGDERDAWLSGLRYGWRGCGDTPAPEPGAFPSAPIAVREPSKMCALLVGRKFPEYGLE